MRLEEGTTRVDEDAILKFITDNFMIGQNPDKLKRDTSFLDSGIIDSLGVLELVSFLEERFSVEVKDEELVPENLDSIRNLVAYIERKQSE